MICGGVSPSVLDVLTRMKRRYGIGKRDPLPLVQTSVGAHGRAPVLPPPTHLQYNPPPMTSYRYPNKRMILALPLLLVLAVIVVTAGNAVPSLGIFVTRLVRAPDKAYKFRHKACKFRHKACDVRNKASEMQLLSYEVMHYPCESQHRQSH